MTLLGYSSTSSSLSLATSASFAVSDTDLPSTTATYYAKTTYASTETDTYTVYNDVTALTTTTKTTGAKPTTTKIATVTTTSKITQKPVTTTILTTSTSTRTKTVTTCPKSTNQLPSPTTQLVKARQFVDPSVSPTGSGTPIAGMYYADSLLAYMHASAFSRSTNPRFQTTPSSQPCPMAPIPLRQLRRRLRPLRSEQVP